MAAAKMAAKMYPSQSPAPSPLDTNYPPPPPLLGGLPGGAPGDRAMPTLSPIHPTSSQPPWAAAAVATTDIDPMAAAAKAAQVRQQAAAAARAARERRSQAEWKCYSLPVVSSKPTLASPGHLKRPLLPLGGFDLEEGRDIYTSFYQDPDTMPPGSLQKRLRVQYTSQASQQQPPQSPNMAAVDLHSGPPKPSSMMPGLPPHQYHHHHHHHHHHHQQQPQLQLQQQQQQQQQQLHHPPQEHQQQSGRLVAQQPDIDPYEFMEHDDPMSNGPALVHSRRGSNVKGKPKSIQQRRNSKKKKQLEDQKKAAEQETQQQQQQQQPHQLMPPHLQHHQQSMEPQSLGGGGGGPRKEQQRPQELSLAPPGGSRHESTSSSFATPDTPGPLSGLPSQRGDMSSNLLSEKYLAVTANDLDQLFDTSDDDDGDDGMGSVFIPSDESLSKPLDSGLDDGGFGKPSHSKTMASGGGPVGTYFGAIAPSELAQMYPTPPSLENPSPCNPGSAEAMATHEGVTAAELAELDIDESLGSPRPEAIKDWSYVYRVPKAQRFVGSSLYAPLKSLPSSKLPSLKDKVVPYFPNKPSWMMEVGSPQLVKSVFGGGRDLGNLPSVSSYGGLLVGGPDDYVNVHSQPAPGLPPATPAALQQSPGAASLDRARATPSAAAEAASPASTPSSYARNFSLEAATPAAGLPEAHSLLVNLLLSDSLLNLFKDHNFTSCGMCVCNMNIKGADVGPYLPQVGRQQFNCVCGFSALVNRRLGAAAGLFAEDEQDIVGQELDAALWSRSRPRPSRPAGAKGQWELAGADEVSLRLIEQLQDQYGSPYSLLSRAKRKGQQRLATASNSLNLFHRNRLDFTDGCEACLQAIEQGRQFMESGSLSLANVKLDDSLKLSCLHSWPYRPVSSVHTLSHVAVYRLLVSLQPLMQEAIQKKRVHQRWERKSKVQGPLTWRSFYHLTYKATPESSEPLPMPSFLVGHDKEWLTLSPYAVHYWDKLSLEPYCTKHDVSYVVVTPDTSYVISSVQAYFRELSAMYETCKLGRHSPALKHLREGILRVGTKAFKSLENETVDEWFARVDNLPDAIKLKTYAQVCKYYLAPYLKNNFKDGSSFMTGRNAGRTADPQPPPTFAVPSSGGSAMGGGGGTAPGPPKTGAGVGGSTQSGQDSSANSTPGGGSLASRASFPTNSGSSSGPPDSSEPGEKQDGGSQQQQQQQQQQESSGGGQLTSDPGHDLPPTLVIYMVDPFSSDQDDENNKTYSMGLFKCFEEIIPALKLLKCSYILQVIPLRQILKSVNGQSPEHMAGRMKALAFSVFSQCRMPVTPTIKSKSLTGFGPAAGLTGILRHREPSELRVNMYTPPYILAPLKDKQTELGETFGEIQQQAGELLCTYCLSHDHCFLLAACTDSRGEMMETCVVNVDVPTARLRRKVQQRKKALLKLWEFCLGVMAASSPRPWRVVLSRLGRLGHGELVDWSGILNRKSLLNRNRQLREMCRTCGLASASSASAAADFPCILSTCLVSTEAEPSFHIMPESVSTDDKKANPLKQQSLSSQLQTPGDASCTHLLVFPTSATTQAPHAHYTSEPMGALGGATDGLLPDDDFLESAGMGMDDLNIDLNHFLGLPVSPTHHGLGGVTSPATSPTANHTNFHLGDATIKASTSQVMLPDLTEAVLLQQPLALGYLVSTAPAGALPDWFWASCPYASNSLPVTLKFALCVHTPSVQQTDEILQTKHNHPLDSNTTSDALKYVLETYNALSWLTVSPSTRDRTSCLPIHYVVLTQLYHSIAAFV